MFVVCIVEFVDELEGFIFIDSVIGIGVISGVVIRSGVSKGVEMWGGVINEVGFRECVVILWKVFVIIRFFINEV